MRKYRVLIAAGMIDRKLSSKIQPILSQPQVDFVYLVRNKPFEAEKLICYFPKGLFSKFKFLSEIYRISIIFWLVVTGRVDLLIGIGHIPHGLFTCTIGRLFRKKNILLLMGKNDLYLTYPNDKFRQKIALKIAKWATLIGTRGSSSANWLEKQGIAKEKIFIPPNVFDFDDFYPRDLGKEYDLVYVGLINFYKRVDLIIEVVEKLVKELNMTRLKVAIIGEGKLKKEIIDLVKKKNLENVIDFLPVGGKEYLNEKLNQSKIFVMTSQGEGLPMVIVEALSCGLPVVIFNDADISDVAVHNYNALLSNLWDTKSFANNINLLLNDPILYERLSKNALNIKKEFGFEYSKDNLQNIWKSVISNLV